MLSVPAGHSFPRLNKHVFTRSINGGVRTLYDYIFVQFVAKALFPSAFEDVNPQRNLETFYEEYLPIKADGVFMQQWQGE